MLQGINKIQLLEYSSLFEQQQNPIVENNWVITLFAFIPYKSAVPFQTLSVSPKGSSLNSSASTIILFALSFLISLHCVLFNIIDEIEIEHLVYWDRYTTATST